MRPCTIHAQTLYSSPTCSLILPLSNPPRAVMHVTYRGTPTILYST